MKHRTGVALAVLALVAGSGIAAPPAVAEDLPAAAGEAVAVGAEYQRNLEARLLEDREAIAADAMSAATKLDLSARLDLEERESSYHVLALASEL